MLASDARSVAGRFKRQNIVQHRPLTDEERAPIEAENGLRQFDRLMEIVEETSNAYGTAPVAVELSELKSARTTA